MNKFFRPKFSQTISLVFKGLLFNRIPEHVANYDFSESTHSALNSKPLAKTCFCNLNVRAKRGN